ncbi:T9SS type B sorting domain-containing protein [Gramella sp. KN1008]|uniref:T9SS type B sorting domain-containing protein n=1 Tax=Gramella sp. KN1008 TaxID=2529298 RepID=UPI0010394522|nr:T9SS type B sorting domain-containing protein [Gramella sp. KN1008]TBW27610.1 T9SS type B sorting domain-containing protein [Gramella sp. KN1008]
MKKLLNIIGFPGRDKIIVAWLFLYFITLACYTQKESAIWYFGEYAGLDFNNGNTPIALTDGKLNTDEGCATISDSNGNLQFYTDGTKVYNREHEVMLNGSGLLGHYSSTQSAIIVPEIGNEKIYYVFTVDGRTGNSKGFHYSKIDLNLDSGLGGVLPNTKNIFLLSDVQEKITAVKHRNGKGIWVITCSGNEGLKEFYSFLLDENGLNTTPVISLVSDLSGGVGYLKASPEGNKLATADPFINGFTLFDFDNESGEVSNQMHIDSPLLPYGGFWGSYGIEFSPNSKLVYVSHGLYGIVQFDISLNDIIKITNSGLVIDSEFGEEGIVSGALQLGINKKIYCARTNSSYLGVINNPNVYGQGSNYIRNGVDLGTGISTLGLPQFIQSYFIDATIEADDVCFGEPTSFQQSITGSFDSLRWDFGDGNTSSDESPNHNYAAPGEYEVSLTVESSGEILVETTTATVHPAPQTVSSVNMKQCDDDLDGYSFFNLNELADEILQDQSGLSLSFYRSLSEAESGANPFPDPELYINTDPSSELVFARTENVNGCYSITKVLLYVSTTQIPAEFYIELFACEDLDDGTGVFDLSLLNKEITRLFPSNQQLDISYYKTVEDALFKTNPTLPVNAYVNMGSPYGQELWVRVDSRVNKECLGLGKHVGLKIVSPELPPIDVGTLCDGSSVWLDVGSDFDSYLWSTGDTTRTIEVSQPGSYGIIATNDYWNVSCDVTAEVEVIDSGVAEIREIVTEGWDSNDNLVIINVTGKGDYEYSLDGVNFQSEAEFRNIDPTLDRVFIRDKNGCGTVVGEFYILYYPKFFTPNGDGMNDYWQIGNANKEAGNRLYIFDRYGKLLTELMSTDRGWDGTYRGRPMPSSDYWFVLHRNNGKSHKGHFSLLR